MIRIKRWIFVFATLCFAVFGFMSFFGNQLKIYDNWDYNYVSTTINQGVFGTVLGNRDIGFLYKNGLQTSFIVIQEDGRGKEIVPNSMEMKQYQKEMYENGIKVTEENLDNIYDSKVNLGGIFYSLVDNFLNLFSIKQSSKSDVFYGISTVGILMLFIFIGYWAFLETGIFSAIFLYISIIFSYWIIPYGSGLSNSLFVYFLPFTVSLSIVYFEHKKNKKIKYHLELLMLMMVIAIKAMMGYELLPTIMISATIPYFYYALMYKWPVKDFILRIIKVSFALLLGAVLAISVHIAQLVLYNQSLKISLERLAFLLGKRSWGDPSKYFPVFEESLTISILDLLKAYGDPLNQKFIGEISIFYIIGLLIVIFGIVIIKICKDKSKKKKLDKYRKIIVLYVCIALSGVAALSTLLVLKAHSYIHVPHTSVVFYLSFVIFASITFGYIIKVLFQKLFKKRNIKTSETRGI